MKTIPGGAYPAMITPFTLDGAIDYPAVARLMKWYEDRNCAGVLALCASSETERLTLEERVELAKFIVEHKGKMTIVVSGHNGDSMEEQIEEMNAMVRPAPMLSASSPAVSTSTPATTKTALSSFSTSWLTASKTRISPLDSTKSPTSTTST